eukprot:PhM_4_TR2677/c0_g1_i1/m.26934
MLLPRWSMTSRNSAIDLFLSSTICFSVVTILDWFAALCDSWAIAMSPELSCLRRFSMTVSWLRTTSWRSLLCLRASSRLRRSVSTPCSLLRMRRDSSSRSTCFREASRCREASRSLVRVSMRERNARLSSFRPYSSSWSTVMCGSLSVVAAARASRAVTRSLRERMIPCWAWISRCLLATTSLTFALPPVPARDEHDGAPRESLATSSINDSMVSSLALSIDFVMPPLRECCSVIDSMQLMSSGMRFRSLCSTPNSTDSSLMVSICSTSLRSATLVFSASLMARCRWMPRSAVRRSTSALWRSLDSNSFTLMSSSS